MKIREFFLGLLASLSLLPHSANAAAPHATAGSAYDFSFTAINGKPMPLADYRGKVLLVVNTASRCGFTPQYDALQKLWDNYRAQGLVVIGVPSGDFGDQELGSAKAIKEFCETNFNITFPLTEKTVVSGKEAHPFYVWAGEKAGLLGRPKWNFHKYLIGRNGQFVDWYSSTTAPDDSKLLFTLQTELSKATH